MTPETLHRANMLAAVAALLKDAEARLVAINDPPGAALFGIRDALALVCDAFADTLCHEPGHMCSNLACPSTTRSLRAGGYCDVCSGAGK